MNNPMTVVNTTPYSWPFDGALVPERCALVICGSGPTWSALCPLDAAAAANLTKLRAVATDAGVLVVLIRHRAMPRAVAPDGPTAQPLSPTTGELDVTAAGIDGFYGSSLDADLRTAGRDQLLVVGHGLESTVHSTVRRANDRGYECLTVEDACVAHEPALRAASISTIEMSGGIFGAVGATDNVVNRLQKDPSEEPS